MKSRNLIKEEWLQILILLTPFILMAILWNIIPDQVPTHWSNSGHPNGYTTKGIGLLLMPALNIGLAALLFWLAKVDPKAYKMNLPSTALKPIRLAITGFISVLTCFSIIPGISDNLYHGSMINIGLAVLFLVLGNYFPAVKPNYFVGIRTPWTLDNPENWRLTHVFAGRLWVSASIIYILLQVFFLGNRSGVVFSIYLGVIIIPPLVYSYMIFQKGKSSAKSDSSTLPLILILVCLPSLAFSQITTRPGLPSFGKLSLTNSGESLMKVAGDTTLPTRLQAALQRTYLLTPAYDRHGVAASVIAPGFAQWSGQAGTKDGISPMSSSLSFEIGSCTKTFIAALILELQDEGKLSLKDSIHKFLPPYPNVDSTITIAQLLNHSSGLYDYLNDDPNAFLLNNAYGTGQSIHWTPDDILQNYVGPPNFKPGKGYRYSNTDYLLLGVIADSIIKQPASAQIHNLFLTPLGLSHTLCPWDDSIPKKFPHNYSNADPSTHQCIDWYSVDKTAQLSEANTAGGMVSTPEDLARWSQSLYTGGVLSKATTAQLLNTSNFHQLTDGLKYGFGTILLGYSYDNQPIYGHFGSMLGYVTCMMTVPHDSVTIAVYLNSLTDTVLCINYANALLWEIYHPAASGVVTIASTATDALVFPNPFRDQITFTVAPGKSTEISLLLYDALGRSVRTMSIPPYDFGANSVTIETSDLKPGIYFYNLHSSSGDKRGCVIKN